MEKFRLLLIVPDAGVWKRALSDMDYRVVSTQEVWRGLDSIRPNRFDCVVIHYDLPDSGMDAIRKIRARDHQTGIVVVTHGNTKKISGEIEDGLTVWSVIGDTDPLDGTDEMLRSACEFARIPPEVAEEISKGLSEEVQKSRDLCDTIRSNSRTRMMPLP
jgi:DNA-binding NtrC family response regulator